MICAMWNSIFVLFTCIAVSQALPKPNPQFTLVDTDDCSVKGDPVVVIEDASDRNCSEFAVDGYRCAPFFACKGGEIIANGVGLLNIRHEDIGRVSRTVALDPAMSKCEKGLEICCRHPDWRDVPPETYIEIGKPSPNCKSDGDYDDDYYSSLECNVNGIAYGDLDEIPDDDPCNSCYCDYGEVMCTKDLCTGKGRKSPEKPTQDMASVLTSTPSTTTPPITTTTLTTKATTFRKFSTNPGENIDFSWPEATESATSTSPILPEDAFVPKSNKADETRFIEMAPEDYDYEEFANALYETSYKLIETTNCDSFGNPSKTIHQEDPKECRDLAKEGFRCVPYYGCKAGELIVTGKGLVDIRNIDPLISKCPGDLEICCRHPDWKDVPLETVVEIKKPSIDCKTDLEVLDDLEKSTCTKDGVTYEDLEEVPSEDCNTCFCDFGLVVCTEGSCDASPDYYFNKDDVGDREIDQEKLNILLSGDMRFRSGMPYIPKCGQRNANGIGVGIKYPNSTIKTAQFGEWPSMCAILNQTDNGEEKFVSGASLIAENVVLTVAHYLNGVSDTSSYNYIIRCGEWDTRSETEPSSHQDRRAKQILFHPGYSGPKMAHNDIAIIILENDFTLDRHIDTICLPSRVDRSEISIEDCIATGWGKDMFDSKSQYQVILKEIELNMVDHKTCEDKLQGTRLGAKFQLDESFNCAGGEAGIDVCTGDGGGPLLCPGPDALDIRNSFDFGTTKEKETYYQVGITSWGIGCGKAGVPGVFADVSEGLCFIEYATKCALGDVNLYDIKDCDGWIVNKYCETTKELQKLNAEISKRIKEKRKPNAKLIRKKITLKKTLKQYEDMRNKCNDSASPNCR